VPRAYPAGMSLRRLLEVLDHLRARLRLGRVGVATLGSGALVLFASVALFGAATEDVTQHNGMAVRDAANLRFFTNHRSPALIDAARAFTAIGALPIVGALAVIAGVVLWRRGVPLVVALAPTGALAVAGVGAAVVKYVVGRARPPLALHLAAESDASFPSGHTTDSTAAFVTIALIVALFVVRRPLVRALWVLTALVLGAAVGASRLVLGVHWPSDVLAGFALGLGVAIAMTTAAVLVARSSPATPRPSDPRLRRLTTRYPFGASGVTNSAPRRGHDRSSRVPSRSTRAHPRWPRSSCAECCFCFASNAPAQPSLQNQESCSSTTRCAAACSGSTVMPQIGSTCDVGPASDA
jgi:undecaprenyl-diphosphatase